MKKLIFIINRISQTELAKRLDLGRANITAWKVAKRIPAGHIAKLETIYRELRNEPKIKR